MTGDCQSHWNTIRRIHSVCPRWTLCQNDGRSLVDPSGFGAIVVFRQFVDCLAPNITSVGRRIIAPAFQSDASKKQGIHPPQCVASPMPNRVFRQQLVDNGTAAGKSLATWAMTSAFVLYAYGFRMVNCTPSARDRMPRHRQGQKGERYESKTLRCARGSEADG